MIPVPHFDILIAFSIIALSAYWWTYIIGDPLDEYKHEAILSIVPFALAVLRLKKMKMLRPIIDDRCEELRAATTIRERLDIRNSYRRMIVQTAVPYMTWERLLLCRVCLHWWACLIVSFCLAGPLLYIALYYLITHLIIRKI